MIQNSLIVISLLASILGFFKPVDIWDNPRFFGSTNFPTSLDSLTNPNPTDSVATVSHSAQHANANDAIEAIEAKLGITSSTAIANSIFAGNGSGSSIWTTFATTTSLFTGNLLATGSSTLQNVTFQNATGTNATTTNLFVSGLASTTNLRANSAIVGDSSIGTLTVGSCTGCSTGGGTTIYTATSTTSRYFAKTLNLSAGDTVVMSGWMDAGNNCGVMNYRISSPWQVATTTVTSDGSCADDPHNHTFSFLATTTETVTFSYQAGNGVTSSFTLWVQQTGFTNQF